MSSSNCCFLICIQISQDPGQTVWYSHLFQNFPQFIVIHTVKGFGIVNKAEIDVFSGILLFFQWSSGCWQLISGSSAFSKNQLEHLEVHSSHTAEAWLGEFWALLYSRVKWVQLCGSLSLQVRWQALREGIRGQTNWNHDHRKLANLITWTTALFNSMKLSHAYGATQDGREMVERSDRMWSTGEGNGKPLQYSCLENPINSMKRQNERILKEELPRSVDAQHATGDQWRNNVIKNE